MKDILETLYRERNELMEAIKFAVWAHGDQRRKYTGEPYMVHSIAVAQRVAQVLPDAANAIKAAVLHDVVEDSKIPDVDELIREKFGVGVLKLVLEVTDVSRPTDGNRVARKAKDREHFSRASYAGKTIKLADLLDNTKSIVAHDPAFARVYMPEKRALLQVLEGGHPVLYQEAKFITDSYFHLVDEKSNLR